MLKFFIQGAVAGLIMAFLLAVVDSRMKNRSTAVRRTLQTIIMISIVGLIILLR